MSREAAEEDVVPCYEAYGGQDYTSVGWKGRSSVSWEVGLEVKRGHIMSIIGVLTAVGQYKRHWSLGCGAG